MLSPSSGRSGSSYRERSIAARGVGFGLEAMRSSSALIRGLKFGSMAGGRRAWCGSSGTVARSAAMRASAASRSACVGSGSTSRRRGEWLVVSFGFLFCQVARFVWRRGGTTRFFAYMVVTRVLSLLRAWWAIGLFVCVCGVPLVQLRRVAVRRRRVVCRLDCREVGSTLK